MICVVCCVVCNGALFDLRGVRELPFPSFVFWQALTQTEAPKPEILGGVLLHPAVTPGSEE